MAKLGWSGVLLLLACEGSLVAGGGPDAGLDGPRDAGMGDAGAQDAATQDAAQDGGGGTLAVLLPAADTRVLDSTAFRFRAPDGAEAVRVVEPVGGAECVASAPHFECLLDLHEAPVGALSVTVTAMAGEGPLASTRHALMRRDVSAPCSGSSAAIDACLVNLATNGSAAGFTGITYLNADDRHANVNTSTMTGIDARVLDQPPFTPPDDVALGVMNESRSWQPTPGNWCSLPRCNRSSRQLWARNAFENNVLYFAPEHRDHGRRDYYQWQAPFFFLSQGSSGSERDEVSKVLRALAAMTPAARTAAVDSKVVASIAHFLLTRTRFAATSAYLTPAAHPTAFANASNTAAALRLAAGMEADALPPQGRLTVDTLTFPEAWPQMLRALAVPFAAGYAPGINPDTPPTEGRFSIEVSLEDSIDASGRTLIFFPAVLRDAGSDVVVTRLNAGGTRWRIEGGFPKDTPYMSNGHERTLSRVTVGFFPHNGVWVGTPATVSVGAQNAELAAPNSNNLDG